MVWAGVGCGTFAMEALWTNTLSAPPISNSYFTVSFVCLSCKHFLHWTKTEVLYQCCICCPAVQKWFSCKLIHVSFLVIVSHLMLCLQGFKISLQLDVSGTRFLTDREMCLWGQRSGHVKCSVISVLAFVIYNWKSPCLCFCAAGQSRWASSPDQTRAGWTSPNGRPNSQGKDAGGTFAGGPGQSPQIGTGGTMIIKIHGKMKVRNREAGRGGQSLDWTLLPPLSGQLPDGTWFLCSSQYSSPNLPFLLRPCLVSKCRLRTLPHGIPLHSKLSVFKIVFLFFFFCSLFTHTYNGSSPRVLCQLL